MSASSPVEMGVNHVCGTSLSWKPILILAEARNRPVVNSADVGTRISVGFTAIASLVGYSSPLMLVYVLVFVSRRWLQLCD